MAAPAIEPTISLKTLTALELEIENTKESLEAVILKLSAHLEFKPHKKKKYTQSIVKYTSVEIKELIDVKERLKKYKEMLCNYTKVEKVEFIKVKKELLKRKPQLTAILSNQTKEFNSLKTLNNSDATLAELISAFLDLKRECPHASTIRYTVFRDYMEHLLRFKGSVTYKICDPGCPCCSSPTEIEKTVDIAELTEICCQYGHYRTQRQRAKNWLHHLSNGIFACIPELKGKHLLNKYQEDYMAATALFIKNKFLVSGIALSFKEFSETDEFSGWFESLFVQ